jgi:adenylate cyclase
MNHKCSDLYTEEYDDVCVMFASITNLHMNYDNSVENERNMLNVLNEIICDFDEQLLINSGSLKIEKIKVAGWTYMAACGLDVARSESGMSMANVRTNRSSRAHMVGRRSCQPVKSEKQVVL